MENLKRNSETTPKSRISWLELLITMGLVSASAVTIHSSTLERTETERIGDENRLSAAEIRALIADFESSNAPFN